MRAYVSSCGESVANLLVANGVSKVNAPPLELVPQTNTVLIEGGSDLTSSVVAPVIMAPPSLRISTLVLVVLQALVLTFLAPSTTSVVHAALGGDCPASCDRFGSSLRATLLFDAAPAAPYGYQQVSAICPGTAQAQDCSPVDAPPLFDSLNPAPPTFRCCDQFTVVTAALGNFVPKAATFLREPTIKIDAISRFTLKTDRNNTLIVGCSDVKTPSLNNGVELDPPNLFTINSVDFCYNPFTGSVSGDPKVVGGDGIAFYFHGRKDQNFCLVSDTDLHVNAHFIGKRPAGRTRDFTWVQALGFVYGSHTLTIAVKRMAQWNNTVDNLEFVYNGEALALSRGSTWASPGAVMTLARSGASHAVELEIKGKMGVTLKAVPIGKHESDVHHYDITSEDCFAHFDMQFRFYTLSPMVDGVLGQTYRPGFKNPVSHGVAMPVMGGVDRFVSSSLLATDCALSQYTATVVARGSAMPRSTASCGSSGLPNGVPGGITCRR